MASPQAGKLTIIEVTHNVDESGGRSSGSGSRANSDAARADVDTDHRDISDMETDDDKGKQAEEYTWTFHGLEAEIVYNFYSKELLDISSKYEAIVGHSSDDVIKIKCLQDKYKSKIQECIDSLICKLATISNQEIPFTSDKKAKVEKFAEELNEKTLLVHIDPVRCIVYIIGDDYTLVQTTAHKLKVEIGLVKATNRQNRQFEPDCTGASGTTSDMAPKLYPVLPCDLSDKTDNYKGGKKNESRNASGGRENSGGGSRSYGGGNFGGGRGGNYKGDKNVTGGSYAGEDFKFDFTLKGGLTVKVYKASITKLAVDTIVNAANNNLMHGGGVARIISEAAGRQLDQESREYCASHGNIAVGENCETTAGRLSYRSVIHAVGPQWHEYRDKEDCLKDLCKTVENVLKQCDVARYDSVAMPAISAGIYGVPKELCANMYILAAVNFSKSLSKRQFANPKELHIIDIDLEILKLVKSSYESWKRDPSSILPETSVPTYLRKNPHKAYGGRHGGYNTGHSDHGKKYDRQNSEPNFHSEEIQCSGCDIGTKQLNQASGVKEIFTVNESLSIHVYKSDIDRLNLDAVVCGIDKTLMQGGLILDTLKRKGGKDFTSAFSKIVKKSYNVKPGNVFKCKGGDLGYGRVMFLVMERLTYADQRELGTYKAGLYTVFRTAMEKKYRSVAVPLLGTGSIQKDSRKLDACCRAMLEAVCDFCAKSQNHRIEEIHFVNNSDDVCKALREVLKSAVTKRKSVFNRSMSSDVALVHSESAVDYESQNISDDYESEDHYATIDEQKMDNKSTPSVDRERPPSRGKSSTGNREDNQGYKIEKQKPEPEKKKGNVKIYDD